RGDAVAPPAAGSHGPVVDDLLAVPAPRGEVFELVADGLGQHDSVPSDRGLDPPCQSLEAGRVLRPGPGQQMLTSKIVACWRRLEARRTDGANDCLWREQEGGRHIDVGAGRRAVRGLAPDARPLGGGWNPRRLGPPTPVARADRSAARLRRWLAPRRRPL